MPSLYERLRQAQPITPQAPKPALPDMLLEEHRVPLGDIGSELFDGQALSLLSQGSINKPMDAGSLLFFDTETTGLSRGAGTVAFLIGYGRIQGQDLVITQVLMRDYPQEAQLLDDLMQRLSQSACLVSFNGSSFDVPLLQGRLAMNRRREDLSAWAQLDLLHVARRVFKLRLGRIPLTRLEEEVFGFVREGDLPGALVPARYFEYLSTQDETLLRDILDHNRQDILTLARLYLHMARLHISPLDSGHHQDIFSLGRAFERQGHKGRAIACYKACSDKTVRDLARLRMAELYRKEHMDDEAVKAFESLRQSAAVSARVFISLAKIYEHRFRDPGRALEIARQGMLYCSQRLGFTAQDDPDFMDLERRSLRLMRKVDKSR